MADGSVLVWRHLLEVQADLVANLEAALQRCHGLSVSEFDVLINLTPGESLRHKELVGRVVLSGSATSRLLDRLARRGLVVREPDGSDQRGVCVRLTEAGRVLRGQAARTNAAIVRQRFAGLTAEDLVVLDDLLAQLRQPEPPEP